jgi:hypothetical protein
MAFPTIRPSDRDELVLNPITGKLDMVRIFNPDRIVTCERNSAGHKFQTFDVQTQKYLEDGPRVVIDQYGNVVTM